MTVLKIRVGYAPILRELSHLQVSLIFWLNIIAKKSCLVGNDARKVEFGLQSGGEERKYIGDRLVNISSIY